jgi:hypothetical protein
MVDQIIRYKKRDNDTTLHSLIYYGSELSELDGMASSEETTVETFVYPSEGLIPNKNERNDVHTHPDATKPAEVSQGLTFEIKRLKLLMQETSDGNDKIKTQPSKMADEIEAELSRMKIRITGIRFEDFPD